MKERYIRNIPALSEEESAVISGKHAAVIGCGGLGGYIIEFLARAGFKKITVCDGDVFEISNLNRQLLSEEALIGYPKALAAKDRIGRINSGVEVIVHDCFLDEDNAREIIGGSDIVFDALDGIEVRKILAKACDEENIPYIYGAISGWSAQAAVVLPGSGFIDTLFGDGVEITDKSSLSFTPPMCASLQVSLGVKYLTGREVFPSRIYYYDLLYNELECIDML